MKSPPPPPFSPCSLSHLSLSPLSLPRFPPLSPLLRSNLAFAALPMRADTGITEAQYG